MQSLKAPTPEQVDAAIARLGKPGANAYFFDTLKNPLWVEPLARRGFFKRPPEPQRHEEQGTISFPDWPELRFLLRMAPAAPNIVGAVVIAIPDTQNARVRQMLVEIGTHLEREFSRAIGLRARDWVDDHFLRSHFGEPVPKLIVHLADQDEIKVAIDIMRRMFRVHEDDSGHRRPAIDAWHLERYLNTCLPSLRARAGVEVLEALCDLLLEAAKPASEDRIEDYSYIWRESILKANFSVKQGRDVLIDAVRDSAIDLARDSKIGVERVCRLLLAPGRPLLKRIALYVASQTAHADDAIVMEFLSDLSLVDRSTTHEEYAILLHVAFPHLPLEARSSLQRLFATDPLQSIPETTRQEMDAAKLERIAKQVLRDRLLAFGSALPDTLTATLSALVQEVGDPPERGATVGTWDGPKSPLSTEELQSLSVQQVAAYARTWVSSNDFNSPRPEGLARAIGDAAKGRLKEFTEQAEIWIGLDPTYVRWIITSITDALRNKATIEDWTPLLRLAKWGTQEDNDPASADDPWADRDTTWRWTRHSVANLIDTALQRKDSRPGFHHRTDVWNIIDRLLRDSDPTIEHTTRGNQDALSISINSTRGIAMHALMRYLWWVHENTPRAEPFTLDVMPEARAALETALTDAHPAIFSAFGEWFRQLYFMDAQWTRALVEAMFPGAEDRRAFWEASWYTFVKYSPPYDPAFDLLRAKYELALARLPVETDDENEREGSRGLGQHLSSYFWRGVGDDFTRKLLLDYFDKSSPEAAGHIVAFLGRGLATEKEIPAHTVTSLMELWEALRRRGTGWAEQKRREVARQFDDWFVSKHLSSEWRLRELEAVLNSGAGMTNAEAVLGELAALADVHPQSVARCLQLLLLDQQQSWFPLLQERESTAALEALLASKDEVARNQAVELVNKLVERGNLTARDIAKRAKGSMRPAS